MLWYGTAGGCLVLPALRAGADRKTSGCAAKTAVQFDPTVTVAKNGGTMTVTLSREGANDKILASKRPALTVACDYARVVVTDPSGARIESTLSRTERSASPSRRAASIRSRASARSPHRPSPRITARPTIRSQMTEVMSIDIPTCRRVTGTAWPCSS